MKVFKRSLAAAVSAIVVFSNFCFGNNQPLIGNLNTVSAESYSDEMMYGDYLSYRKFDEDDDGTYDYIEISGCDKSATEVNISSEIDGLSVKSIGYSAFGGCANLTNITIPDSVTFIEDFAFVGCESLTSITIPHSVKSIGENAFNLCKSLENINISEDNNNYSSVDGVLFNKDKTELIRYPSGKNKSEYTIPDSVTSIIECAFLGCDGLTSITIPDSVTSIGESAFSHCYGLKSIAIPDSVTSIEWGTFSNSLALTSVTIPDSVTSIGEWAFNNCISLENISVSENNNYYCSVDDVLFNKAKTELIQYSIGNSRAEYIIPDSVTSIEYSAFYGCKALTNIIIPDSVTTIKPYAFSDCSSLTSITIKNPECEIDANYGGSPISNDCDDGNYYYNGVICGYKNSTAQKFAEIHRYTFKEIDAEPPVTTTAATTEPVISTTTTVQTTLNPATTAVAAEITTEATTTATTETTTAAAAITTTTNNGNLPQTGNNSLKTVAAASSALVINIIGAYAVVKSGVIRRKKSRNKCS